jgi:hypothetical protein
MVVLIISRVILLKLDFWCSYLRTKVMRAACARTEKNCTDFEKHNSVNVPHHIQRRDRNF